MRLLSDNQNTEVITNNEGVKSAYKIGASSKAFAILSSNIYSNKIRAIVREISSNAVDAHLAAGNSGKFHVKLPSHLDPVFRLRDFGIGLSHEDIMELYQTYFESTKTNSDLFIGALGLGSKSPFSYTTTFTVISYYNGIESTYVAFMDNGVPTTQLVSTTPTTEHNGLMIQVPVKPNDIERWISEAKYVYSTFDRIYPEFIDAPEGFNIDYIELNEDGYLLTDSSKFGSGISFIMGGVRYPLNLESCPIPEDAGTIKILENNGHLRGRALLIDIPIGFADIEPGREGLSYDSTTEANVSSRLIEVSDLLIANYREDMLEAKTPRELYKIVEGLPQIIPRSVFRETHKIFGATTTLEDVINKHSWTKNELLTKKSINVSGQGVRINAEASNSEYDKMYPLVNSKNAILLESIFGTQAKVVLIELDTFSQVASRKRLNIVKAVRNEMKHNKDPFTPTLYITRNVGPNTDESPDTIQFYKYLSQILGEDLKVFQYSSQAIENLLSEFYDPMVDSVSVNKSSKSSGTTRSALFEEVYEISKVSNTVDVNRESHTSLDLGTSEVIEYLIEQSKNPNTYLAGYYYHNNIPINNWDKRVHIRDSVRDFAVDWEALQSLNIPFVGSKTDKNKLTIINITSKMMPAVLKAIERGELSKYKCVFNDLLADMVVDELKTFEEDQEIIPLSELSLIVDSIQTHREMLKYFKKHGELQDRWSSTYSGNWQYRNVYQPLWDLESVEKNLIDHAVAVVLNQRETNVKVGLVVDYWKFLNPKAFDIGNEYKSLKAISEVYDTLSKKYEKYIKKIKNTIGSNLELDAAISHYNTYKIVTCENSYNNSAIDNISNRIRTMDPEDYTNLYALREYIRESLGAKTPEDIELLYPWARKVLNTLTTKYS